MTNEAPFWQRKPLEDMNEEEWESLCDGCGRCCLVKLEDEDTGDIYETDIACTLFDGITCRCTDYAKREIRVPDCVRLTPQTVRSLSWLPESCAYRLIAQGQDLPHWHPLVSGTKESVILAGISVKDQIAGHEQDFTPEMLLRHITHRL
jgi:uncharacterized protein